MFQIITNRTLQTRSSTAVASSSWTHIVEEPKFHRGHGLFLSLAPIDKYVPFLYFFAFFYKFSYLIRFLPGERFERLNTMDK